jgi:hypothetical protein
MNNGNINNFSNNQNNNQPIDKNHNAVPDNTMNFQLKDNIDMKKFIDDNNIKDTIREISASNDFCIICEVKIKINIHILKLFNVINK